MIEPEARVLFVGNIHSRASPFSQPSKFGRYLQYQERMLIGPAMPNVGRSVFRAPTANGTLRTRGA